ncbi:MULTISPECIES: DUF6612 family protein [Sporosarcina]|uniref:DUF6612 family protein n=1 Tax=Sporosarcina TaxID=1569 RepID=UPI00058F3029|nr:MULTISPECIES: DUF6612 family protein [Sporosarcina]WJY27119.1 hypothetical protein QWT68_13875 [Sporosarcina sp. 0.2-SM1T-5]
MKNLLKGTAATLLALTLAACGSDDTPKTESGASAETGAKTESAETNGNQMTTKEVYQKAVDASETIESLHGQITIDQNMKVVDDDSMRAKNKISLDMDVITDPMKLHQVMKMDGGPDAAATMEMYAQDGELYLQTDDMEGQWMSIPADMHDEILDGLDSSNAMLELSLFQEFDDKFTMEEKEDQYVMHFSAAGEEFSDLLKELMEQDTAEATDGEVGDIDVKKIELTVYLDKETYYTDSYDLKLDAIMDIEGYRTVVLQTVSGDVTEINEVEPFDIPEEIRTNAVSMGK